MNINRIAALICHPSLFKRSKSKSTINEKVILTNQLETSGLDQVPPTRQELKQRRRRYGVCLRCGSPLSDKAWCQLCEGQKLQRKFSEWTSGNQHINSFIQSTQLRPLNKDSYLSWIPYDDLTQIKYVANGGFSAVYSALWDRFKTDHVVDVVLKRLHHGQISNPEFLKDQITMFTYAASQKSTIVHCYGITQHPTEGYMLVMERGEEDDMRNYLRIKHQDLLWSDKIYLLRDIARALSVLHLREFVHGDLHTGNILKKYPKPSLLDWLGLANDRERECIVDLPLSYVSTELFGVMPYVAPEVFNNGYYTKASDVYSFGLVMWELAVGQTPYSDYAHDKDLMEDICRGVRPDIDKTTPQFYVDLMKQCWDPEPLNRPSAHVIKEKIEGWISAIKKPKIRRSKEHRSIVSQMRNSDDAVKKNHKRQLRIPELMAPTPIPIATTFYSQNLGSILALDGHSSASSTRRSTFSSGSYRQY